MQDLAEGVAVLGPEGEIRFISDSGANLLNSDEHKLIGKNFLNWCDDASRQRLLQQLSNETPEHAPFSVHYRGATA